MVARLVLLLWGVKLGAASTNSECENSGGSPSGTALFPAGTSGIAIAQEDALKDLIGMSDDDDLYEFRSSTFCCGDLGSDGTLDKPGEVFVVHNGAAMRKFHFAEHSQALKFNFWSLYCDPTNGNLKEIQLKDADLGGRDGGSTTIPDSVDSFTSLVRLELDSNELTGFGSGLVDAPSTLHVVNLADNDFEMTGAEAFERLSQVGSDGGANSWSSIRELTISGNDITGALPDLDRFQHLTKLLVRDTKLEGALPRWAGLSWGDLSQLQVLDLSQNDFEGELPEQLSGMTQLEELVLSNNDFTGQLPDVKGLPNLRVLQVDYNDLEGSIPDPCPNGASSPPCASNLEEINLCCNDFEGELPAGLEHLTHVQKLHAQQNRLEGMVAATLSNKQDLAELDISYNFISASVADLIDAIDNRGYIYEMDLSHNQLTGELGANLAEFTRAGNLWFNHNAITGALPHVGPDQNGDNGITLVLTLDVSNNAMSGDLPDLSALTHCRTLKIEDNRFTGTLDNMPAGLRYLEAERNQLSSIGQLPSSITSIDIDGNQFANTIDDLGLGSTLVSLTTLSMARNLFTGQLSAIGQLPAIVRLSANDNQLTGGITLQGGQAHNLNRIELQNNNLSGRMSNNPFWCQDRDYASSKDLYLDLSGNSFAGPFPSCISAPNWMPGSSLTLKLADNELTANVNEPFFHSSAVVVPYISYLDYSNNGDMTGDPLTWIERLGSGHTEQSKMVRTLMMANNQIEADFSEFEPWLPNTMEYLDISGNGMTGSIGSPESVSGGIGRLVYLRRFDARNNRLTGTLDPIQNLIRHAETNMVPRLDLLLSDNEIGGSMDWIRNNFENSHIEMLDLSNNNIGGNMPFHMYLLPVSRLKLANNRFTGLIPQLLPLCKIEPTLEGIEEEVDAYAGNPDLNMTTVAFLLNKEKQWLNDTQGGATCTERAATSVPADAAACEAVTALDDEAACHAVQLDGTSDDNSPACIYTPAEPTWRCLYEVDLSGNDFDCPAPSAPPGTNVRPWVNPVYHSAECACKPGGTCRGDGTLRDPTTEPYWLGVPRDDNPAADSFTTAQEKMEECRAFCSPCMKGHYQDGRDADGCLECPAGKYSDELGQGVCDDCPAGRFGDIDNTETGMTNRFDACTACNESTYQSTPGETECLLAPAGTYAPFREMPAALPCPNGTYTDTEGNEQCEWCPIAKFSDEPGATECKQCPFGQVTDVPGADHPLQCNAPDEGMCPDGFFGRYEEFITTGTLVCYPTEPGQMLQASAGASWAQDVIECPGNSIAPEPNMTRCVECHVGLFANPKATVDGEVRPAKVFCDECDVRRHHANQPTTFPVPQASCLSCSASMSPLQCAYLLLVLALMCLLLLQFLGTASDYCKPETEYLAPIGALLVLLFFLVFVRACFGGEESTEDHYKEEVEKAQEQHKAERGESSSNIKHQHHHHHHSQEHEDAEKKVHRHHHHQHHSA
eukprot:COSAG02_NODE_2_length_75708_cov_87.013953_47_plen_1465_part_00